MRWRSSARIAFLVWGVERFENCEKSLLFVETEAVIDTDLGLGVLHRLAPAAVERRLDGAQAHPLVLALGEHQQGLHKLIAVLLEGRLDLGRRLVRRALLPAACGGRGCARAEAGHAAQQVRPAMGMATRQAARVRSRE